MPVPVATLKQLHYGRTEDGAVGCRVQPTGDNDQNHAWVKATARKRVDARAEPPLEVVTGYEVEYLELRADYDVERDDWDSDLFFVRREIFYNLASTDELAQVLHRWLPDLQQLRPLASTDYP